MNELLALAPLVTVGNSVLLSWVVSLVIIAAVVFVIAWATTKVAGSPDALPGPVKSGIWIIVAIGVILFVFLALGVAIP